MSSAYRITHAHLALAIIAADSDLGRAAAAQDPNAAPNPYKMEEQLGEAAGRPQVGLDDRHRGRS